MRARIKDLSTLEAEGDRHLCCAQAKNAALRHQGLVIDIVGKPVLGAWRCGNCGAENEELHYRVIRQEFGMVSVASIDIEDGS